MPAGQLPADGDLRIGAVTLPAGTRVVPPGGRRAVAWITSQPVGDVPRAWAILSDAHEQTGLVPVLVTGTHADQTRPWQAGELYPQPAGDLDGLDAAEVLASCWDNRIPAGEEDDAEAAAQRAPFSRRFPGLAPRQDQELTVAERGRAIGSLQAAWLALVPAALPADVVALTGWVPGNWTGSSLLIGAVLRSWEDRFGARLVELGPAEIRLLVDRPPRTQQAAQAIAAEHFAFADECGGKGLSTVPRIAADLISNPFWSFWWD